MADPIDPLSPEVRWRKVFLGEVGGVCSLSMHLDKEQDRGMKTNTVHCHPLPAETHLHTPWWSLFCADERPNEQPGACACAFKREGDESNSGH